jgi:predicted RNase H-like HicB family nuclease
MVLKYINIAMHQARYETLTDDGTYIGEIPALHGVRARDPSLGECRERLAGALEKWILFRVHHHLRMPVLDGVDLNMREDESG